VKVFFIHTSIDTAVTSLCACLSSVFIRADAYPHLTARRAV